MKQEEMCEHKNGWYIIFRIWFLKRRAMVCSDCGEVIYANKRLEGRWKPSIPLLYFLINLLIILFALFLSIILTGCPAPQPVDECQFYCEETRHRFNAPPPPLECECEEKEDKILK